MNLEMVLKWFGRVGGQELRTLMTEKMDMFAMWALMLLVQSLQRSKSHALCHLLPWWEDCFFHQGQRQVTNWAVSKSLWDNSTEPPPLHSSQTPTSTRTHAHTHPCIGTHANKRTLSPPLQSKAYSHIKSIKFTLLGLSHKKNTSLQCPCSMDTLYQPAQDSAKSLSYGLTPRNYHGLHTLKLKPPTEAKLSPYTAIINNVTRFQCVFTIHSFSSWVKSIIHSQSPRSSYAATRSRYMNVSPAEACNQSDLKRPS